MDSPRSSATGTGWPKDGDRRGVDEEVRALRRQVSGLQRRLSEVEAELVATGAALADSRSALTRGLARLGGALRAGQDLGSLRGEVVEAAMGALQAEAGALWLLGPAGEELLLRVGRNLAGRFSDGATGSGSVSLSGPGVLASVVRSGVAVAGRGLTLAPDEPWALDVLAVPLLGGDRLSGVLALYDRAAGEPFSAHEVEAMTAFATSAAVALENAFLNLEARRQALTDGLTGLWNRRYLMMAMAREVERATRFGRPLAVVMLDLDHFKLVNDSHGHQRGDAVLVEVAQRVRSVIREVDTCARYGGEEITLVLPEADLDGGVQLAERIREELAARPFGTGTEEPLRVSGSLGVAAWPEHGPTPGELLRAADDALYAAKRAGRDRVVAASDGGGGGAVAADQSRRLSGSSGHGDAAR